MKDYIIRCTVACYTERIATANIREYIRNHFDLKTSYTVHRCGCEFEICDRIEKNVIYTVTKI